MIHFKNSKHILLFICFICLPYLNSCESTVERKHTQDTIDGMPISIVEFDSCEYVFFPLNGSKPAHKGNCKYCTERLIKLLKK